MAQVSWGALLIRNVLAVVCYADSSTRHLPKKKLLASIVSRDSDKGVASTRTVPLW